MSAGVWSTRSSQQHQHVSFQNQMSQQVSRRIALKPHLAHRHVGRLAQVGSGCVDDGQVVHLVSLQQQGGDATANHLTQSQVLGWWCRRWGCRSACWMVPQRFSTKQMQLVAVPEVHRAKEAARCAGLTVPLPGCTATAATCTPHCLGTAWQAGDQVPCGWSQAGFEPLASSVYLARLEHRGGLSAFTKAPR